MAKACSAISRKQGSIKIRRPRQSTPVSTYYNQNLKYQLSSQLYDSQKMVKQYSRYQFHLILHIAIIHAYILYSWIAVKFTITINCFEVQLNTNLLSRLHAPILSSIQLASQLLVVQIMHSLVLAHATLSYIAS